MSALGQKQTFAVQSITSSERACNVAGMFIFKLCAALRFITSSNVVGCMTGKMSWFVPLKNAARVDPDLAPPSREARPIAGNATGYGKLTKRVDCRHPKLRCQLYNLFTLYRKKRIGTDQKPIRVQLCDSRKGSVDFVGELAFTGARSSPIVRAAACTSLISGTESGLVGLTSTGTTFDLQPSSRNISRRFCPSGPVIKVRPVALPPGWFKLATRPAATGSRPTMKTIGMVVVATLAASAAGGASATIRSTGRRTNSAANVQGGRICPRQSDIR